ncbi:MAG: 4-aminobutyrate aminotransferase-like enzyme, partial [Myxococcota bacterium]
VAQDANGMVGMSFAGPLELWWGVDGPRQDPNMGKGNTLYSADITVAARARGRGIGRRLRQLQLSAALRERTADKTPRYAFVTGRNRMGAADAMWAINRKLGAYTVREYTDQYGERSGRSRYYRIPLRRWDRRAFANDEGVHPLLARARSLGVFDDPSLTKLTVSNFITAGFARYAETMRAMAPRGTNHLYFTSCLDEMSDKAIRVLKHKRTAGQQVVSFDGAYFGHTTAASRSLTDWSAFYGADPDAMRQPPGEGYFPWPRVASASELDAVVAEHGAEAILGVFVESVQARTGQVLSQDEWSALCEFRDRTGIPLVLSETCTGGYRSGNGAWWLDGMTGDPDMVLWWHGGQIGHIFTNDATWVSKPLAFISTWDGDELSATRNLWQLWAASEANVADAGRRLAEGVEKAGYPRPEGAGLYQILKASEREIDTIVDRLERWGVPVAWTERVGGQRLILKPPVWSSNDDLDRIVQAMREARR